MTHTLSKPEQWVDLYGDALFCFALKFISQPDQAQNLVQETLLAGLKNQAGFQGKSTEKTWLLGILKHKITDHLRLKYRETPASQLVTDDMHVEEFFDNVEQHLRKEPSEWEFHPESLLEKGEFWQAFHECLGKLPEKAGQAFSLREVEDTSAEEICKILNISSTNLWVLLHRARLQLRQCLEMNWFEKNV